MLRARHRLPGYKGCSAGLHRGYRPASREGWSDEHLKLDCLVIDNLMPGDTFMEHPLY